jgi:aryl-alcohol dehydrogenase-like predicted oxidoreductase
MNLRTLGQSDLKITPIGIGAWAIGGGQWEFAWGPQDDDQSIGDCCRPRNQGALYATLRLH